MMMNIYLIIILIFISEPALAKQKFLVVLGGGGEPEGKTTIFDHSIKAMGKFHSSHPEYQVELGFNGGHSNTEKIIKDSFNGVQNRNFTSDSFEEIITKYEKMIESGEIKSGDNLLISIDSHGSIKDGETHKISTSSESIRDFQRLGEKSVSLDRLKKLSTLAKEKDINLGIIDLSCFSGNTQVLANSKTCVISGTGTNHTGIAGPGNLYFPNNFIDQLTSSENLEEAFLKARKEKSSLTFPMISSEHGRKIQDLLYDHLTPYLYKYSKHGLDFFIPFIEKDYLLENQCRVDSSFREIQMQLKKLITTTHTINFKKFAMNLENAVRRYHDYIESIKAQMDEIHFNELNDKKEFCSTIPKNGDFNKEETAQCISFTLENILMIDFKSVFKFLEDNMVSAQNSNQQKSKYIAQYLNYKKAQQWRDDMLKKNPNIVTRQNFWKKFHDLSSKTRYYALQVVEAEKKVYDTLYRQSLLLTKNPNPCQDFRI